MSLVLCRTKPASQNQERFHLFSFCLLLSQCPETNCAKGKALSLSLFFWWYVLDLGLHVSVITTWKCEWEQADLDLVYQAPRIMVHEQWHTPAFTFLLISEKQSSGCTASCPGIEGTLSFRYCGSPMILWFIFFAFSRLLSSLFNFLKIRAEAFGTSRLKRRQFCSLMDVFLA